MIHSRLALDLQLKSCLIWMKKKLLALKHLLNMLIVILMFFIRQQKRLQIRSTIKLSTLKRQVAVQFEETKLREAIKKAILKKLVNEQTGFETRMFQVNLKIQVDPSMGGGIEQKLNRIRAIEGVTVVGHDEPQRVTGREVIEARIKFHPSSDALRPGTYVSSSLYQKLIRLSLFPVSRLLML